MGFWSLPGCSAWFERPVASAVCLAAALAMAVVGVPFLIDNDVGSLDLWTP